MREPITVVALGEAKEAEQVDAKYTPAYQETTRSGMATWCCNTIKMLGDSICENESRESECDPYVRVGVDPQDDDFQTPPIMGAGANAKWTERNEFDFEIKVDEVKYWEQTEIKFKVLDEDIGANDLIGKHMTPLLKALIGRHHYERWLSDKSIPIRSMLPKKRKKYREKIRVPSPSLEKGNFAGLIIFELSSVEDWKKVKVKILSCSDLRLTSMMDGDEDNDFSIEAFVQQFGGLIVYITVAAFVFNYMEEEWSVFDSFWFVVVTISTVGYGDLSPTSWESRLVNVLIMTSGLVMGTMGIGYLIRAIVAVQKMMNPVAGKHGRTDAEEEEAEADQFVYLGVTFYALVLVSTLFYYFYEWPEQGLYHSWDSFVICLHFIMVTLTTVGYGDISPTTDGGRAYGIFFILIGVTMLAKLVTVLVEREKRIARLAQQAAHLEVSLSSPYELEDYENFIHDGIEARKRAAQGTREQLYPVSPRPGGSVVDREVKVPKLDFLAKQLIDGQYCTKDNILDILERFGTIDEDGSGHITKEDFLRWFETETASPLNSPTHSRAPSRSAREKPGQVGAKKGSRRGSRRNSYQGAYRRKDQPYAPSLDAIPADDENSP